jgi:hypothetical protein
MRPSMLDKATALSAAEALGRVIAALAEDCSGVTADRHNDKIRGTSTLDEVVDDMIVLTTAVLVLARRVED